MTIRQVINKIFYPALMFLGKLKKKEESALINKAYKKPLLTFYTLKSTLNNNTDFLFEQLKGKKVLIVNTASDCGYTGQYDELQKLKELYADKLVILGFPSNDFGEQEKENDTSIAEFCKSNFNISFSLMKKSVVRKQKEQNEIYQWLTDANKNGWNNQPPVWNFSKYLINEEGILTHYFSRGVSPLSKELLYI